MITEPVQVGNSIGNWSRELGGIGQGTHDLVIKKDTASISMRTLHRYKKPTDSVNLKQL